MLNDRKTSKSVAQPVQPAQSIRKVRMKIQTVRTVEFDTAESGETVGACVEGLIADCQADGFYPNKLVIELNPDPVNRPERCE